SRSLTLSRSQAKNALVAFPSWMSPVRSRLPAPTIRRSFGGRRPRVRLRPSRSRLDPSERPDLSAVTHCRVFPPVRPPYRWMVDGRLTRGNERTGCSCSEAGYHVTNDHPTAGLLEGVAVVRILRAVLASTTVMLLCAVSAVAQTSTGSIYGTVTDEQGSPIPG